MSTYNMSTPEGRAEVRRLVEAVPRPLDSTDGVVWTVEGRQIDDEGNYETWQVKVADTSDEYAPFFAAAPTLLLAALEEIERLEGELAALRASVSDLYMAGRWDCATVKPVDAANLWARLRDAAGIAEGTATAAGVHSLAAGVVAPKEER